MHPETLKQIRRLTTWLMASVAVNVLLLSFLFYTWIRELPPTPYALKPFEEAHAKEERGNDEMIRQFLAMPLEQLVARLQNLELVENGYSQRDLALGCLVTLHHFNLAHALSGLPPQDLQRRLTYRDGSILVYTGLTEANFQAIVQYATTERWPFTAEGLHRLLQKEQEPSLLEAFALTPEFQALEILFQRAEPPTDRNLLLTLVVAGKWETLRDFAEQQRLSQELSPERRQKFLLSYSGPIAASLLIHTDLKRVDDAKIIQILQQLTEKSPAVEKFARSMFSSPRSNAVRQAAAAHFSPIPLPQPILAKKPTALPFLKPIAKPIAPPRKPATREVLYIVQDGDSLWKISKRFQVDVDTLRRLNKITGQSVKPGRALRIPLK